MRLLRPWMCVSAAVAAAFLAAASGALSATTTPPRAQLMRFSCQRALDPGNRSTGVRAVMRPVAGTMRLEVRFQLLQWVGPGAPTVLHAGDLGSWVTPSNPTLGQVPGDVWRLDKTVLDLAAPATYQFRVAFRWIGVSGHVIGTAVRYSRRCREPELRPDLAVTSLTASPVAGVPGQDLYTAVIANRGLTGAGAFEVLFVPGGGGAATTDDIGFLGAGRSRTVTFTGPPCNPADPARVTADAAHQIDDYNRANNTATAACPASG